VPVATLLTATRYEKRTVDPKAILNVTKIINHAAKKKHFIGVLDNIKPRHIIKATNRLTAVVDAIKFCTLYTFICFRRAINKTGSCEKYVLERPPLSTIKIEHRPDMHCHTVRIAVRVQFEGVHVFCTGEHDKKTIPARFTY